MIYALIYLVIYSYFATRELWLFYLLSSNVILNTVYACSCVHKLVFFLQNLKVRLKKFECGLVDQPLLIMKLNIWCFSKLKE